MEADLIKLTRKIIEQVGYVVSPCLPRCCYPLIDIFLGGAGSMDIGFR